MPVDKLLSLSDVVSELQPKTMKKLLQHHGEEMVLSKQYLEEHAEAFWGSGQDNRLDEEAER